MVPVVFDLQVGPVVAFDFLLVIGTIPVGATSRCRDWFIKML
jgi:hypothetical protein